MKPRYGLLALSLSLLLSVAMPAAAQDDDYYEDQGDYGGERAASALPERPWYISPMFSYSVPDSDRGTDDGLGGMLSIGKKVTHGLTLELTGYFSSMDAKNGGDSAELSGGGIGAMIFPSSTLPDLYAVLALMHGSTKGQPGPVSRYDSTVFDIGLGYLVPLTSRIVLRGEARYRTDQHDNRNIGGPGSKTAKAFQEGVFNLGLLFPFGVSQPVEEASPVEVVVAEAGDEADSDGDGVADSLDNCPDTPAGTPVGEDGCPLDSDGDGIPDATDECPNSPAGAKVLANGCALTGDCRTPRAGEQVDENGCAIEQRFILKGVKFEFDSDRLTPEAREILNDVAGTLEGYPDVKVELQGHTDNIGSAAYNVGLSERRAIAVKRYLADRGIAADRMSPMGYGQAQPVDSNDTEEGRENNRRVELKVNE